jgi:hypothetical protein
VKEKDEQPCVACPKGGEDDERRNHGLEQPEAGPAQSIEGVRRMGGNVGGKRRVARVADRSPASDGALNLTAALAVEGFDPAPQVTRVSKLPAAPQDDEGDNDRSKGDHGRSANRWHSIHRVVVARPATAIIRT